MDLPAKINVDSEDSKNWSAPLAEFVSPPRHNADMAHRPDHKQPH
jgi:hypothetical protein